MRWLFSLLGPYRRQVLMMLGALILATGATLAPPFLVGKAISAVLDGDTTALILIVAAFLVAALVGWGTSYVQTYLVGWVGRARSAGPAASGSSRTSSRCRSGSSPATGPGC